MILLKGLIAVIIFLAFVVPFLTACVAVVGMACYVLWAFVWDFFWRPICHGRLPWNDDDGDPPYPFKWRP